MTRIAIVLIHYRSLADTVSCLESLGRAKTGDVRIFLVNNHSGDGSRAALETSMQATGIPAEYLDPGFNSGFAGGCNLGIRRALDQGYDHVLLLNNDTVVPKDFLENLERCADAHPDEVLAGKVVDAATGGPTHNIGTLSPWTGRVRHILDNDFSGPIDFVSGCLMLVPRAAFKRAGLFDERLFMYCEDMDLCLRFKREGIRIRYCPEFGVRHLFSASAKRFRLPKEYYIQRNQTYVILRRGSLVQRVFYVGFLVLLPFYKAVRRPGDLWDAVRGAWDGILGRTGKRHAEIPG